MKSIAESMLTPEQRSDAVEFLEGYFARIDAQSAPVSPAEKEVVLNEALRTTRPNYRPAD